MSEVKKEEINHVVDIWLPDNTQIWRGATLIITPPMKMELKGSLELNYANSEEAVDTPMLTT